MYFITSDMSKNNLPDAPTRPYHEPKPANKRQINPYTGFPWGAKIAHACQTDTASPIKNCQICYLDNRLTLEQVNLYLVAGLPKKTLKIVEAKLPEANHIITAPPKIKVVHKILEELCVENSLQSFTCQNFVDIEVHPAPQVAKSAQKAVCFEPAPAQAPPSHADMSMDEILARMEQLQILQAELISRFENRLSGPGTRPPTPEAQHHCFVCRQSGTHKLGWKNCPTTKELFDENLVMGDISGHLVAWDGSDLPTTRDPGGVAAILRQRARENTNCRAQPLGGPVRDQKREIRVVKIIFLEF
ncbi:hypothetical protein B0H10DRAFT_1944184 [Mycena sp. CBHHK59/15]|nr:hypothetical protein B0H10DRAFT_1944184 [Mycena sp. CBHHK59/15]